MEERIVHCQCNECGSIQKCWVGSNGYLICMECGKVVDV